MNDLHRFESRAAESVDPSKHPYLAEYLLEHPEACQRDWHKSLKSKGRYFAPDPVCWACLGPHDASDCLEKRCFKCSRVGHSYNECECREICTYCRKHSHSNLATCPLYVYRQTMNPALQRYATCIVCGIKGHVQCTGYSTNGGDQKVSPIADCRGPIRRNDTLRHGRVSQPLKPLRAPRQMVTSTHPYGGKPSGHNGVDPQRVYDWRDTQMCK